MWISMDFDGKDGSGCEHPELVDFEVGALF
jgi:hypothetical protein